MSRSNHELKLLRSIMDVIDTVVELYLQKVIAPFLKLHEHFYSQLNAVLRGMLNDNKKHIPDWFTANFITYLRTALVVPTILLLAWGYIVLPSVIVLLVDFGDFLDGVVARYWVDIHKERELQEKEKLLKKKNKGQDEEDDEDSSSTPSKKKEGPASSDDDSYEVVTTGSSHSLPSWTMLHRSKQYGGFVDAVCDKAYVVPCWIFLMSTVGRTQHLRTIQYLVLWCLVLAETASGSIRFRAYFTSGGVAAPAVKGLDFSTSAVKADHIGKAKQTFEMVGTTLYILPSVSRYVGLLLLTAAVPLAYESVRRKVKQRAIYICASSKKFDHHTLKLWMQAKAMGSKLIVGVVDKAEKDMVLNACAASSVDQVIAEAPIKVDLMFLDAHGIDYVVTTPGQEKTVTDELLAANRCLILREDGIAQPLKPKELHQD